MPITAQDQENRLDDAARSGTVETDRYFFSSAANKSSNWKVKSSNATLASLPNRPDQLTALGFAQQYADSVAGSAPDFASQFADWSRWMLVGGFSLLFYGAGSKRGLMRQFQQACLGEQLCLEFDCYHPDASLKALLTAIVEDIIGAAPPTWAKSAVEVARFAASELEKTDVVLYLLIHGLDGPQMRKDKVAEAVAALVASRSVRMAASLDHRLCQLLWDQSQLCAMSCLWCPTPTQLPHLEELPPTAAATGRAGSGAGAGGGGAGVDAASSALQMSGLRHLMASLTANARAVFVLLASRQLERPGEPWPLDELYWACLDRMLVTSELTLHAHLKEFRDHGLVRLKTGGGGQAGDTVLVHLPAETLTQFLAAFGDDCDL